MENSLGQMDGFEQARLYGQELDVLCHQGAEQQGEGAEQAGQGGQMENNMGRGSLASGVAEEGEALHSLWLQKCA